ncbi:MAG TPA: hypothetical protein VIO94_10630 [Phenylobacterium sp.]
MDARHAWPAPPAALEFTHAWFRQAEGRVLMLVAEEAGKPSGFLTVIVSAGAARIEELELCDPERADVAAALVARASRLTGFGDAQKIEHEDHQDHQVRST